YFRAATEITFEMSQVRFASDEHAYVQFLRRYAVEGTEDERVETVFLGFRLLDGRWRLREVRVAS
ncbi:MAG: hypothetical protein OEZ54_08550, partial [Gemmatimonadota bacterium]|nr:hypothetical protein [Gemmatimonadota bacterium]